MLLLPAILLGREAREQARIDFLLHNVETAQGVKFIRNGKDYDGAAAAAHLRTKLGYLGERVKTAEEFVKYCASESSLTHRKYQIRAADGTVQDAASYFGERLREFDREKKERQWRAISFSHGDETGDSHFGLRPGHPCPSLRLRFRETRRATRSHAIVFGRFAAVSAIGRVTSRLQFCPGKQNRNAGERPRDFPGDAARNSFGPAIN